MRIPQNDKSKEGKGWIYCGSGVIIVSMIIIICGLFSAMVSPINIIQLLLPSFSFYFPILIIGVVSFLYRIKKVTSLRKFPHKKRDLFIIYCGCCSFLISIILVIYGYGSSTWCGRVIYSFFDCYFRFSGLSKAIIYSGFSLLFISILFITYGLYQIRKVSLGDIYHICRSCGEKNRFVFINKDLGLYSCKKCKAKNYLE